MIKGRKPWGGREEDVFPFAAAGEEDMEGVVAVESV